MRIIDRYVIREVLWPFVIGLFVFTFLLIIPFLIRLAEDLIAKGVSGLVIVQLMAGMSPGWLVTLPLPVPTPAEMVTLNGPLRKRASTVALVLIVAVQVPVPVQVRNQPLNACPAFGVAVRVTLTPRVNAALHPVAAATPLVTVQLMPAGLDLTVPSPVPLPMMVRVLVTSAAAASTSVIVEVSWQPCSSASVADTRMSSAMPEEGRGLRI